MSRLLLIEGDALRLGLDEQLVERVELEGDAQAPSLFAGLGLSEESERVGQAGQAGHTERGEQRVLVLREGARVRVPASMRLIEDVEVMALPELLRPFAAEAGVVGLVELEGTPTLVCDPRLANTKDSHP
ncbi:hypothetical protein G6O69_10395 [Pseudenhygromyxa sp. WMMC2535]|uniref:hypothetical protein n=1 Tax=Pseudenhygromyxa sp. WMMC2535 TaxID=2712867 RepID=UPI0015580A3A|nr:hypothetical protein [Pseudenhygromyxa sp. WMMC2535]NVB38240.1 hypothetical protein [Pseudenhygromyxa sp. WMMC2535]